MGLKVELDINEVKEILAAHLAHKYHMSCTARDVTYTITQSRQDDEIAFFVAVTPIIDNVERRSVTLI